MKLEKIKSLSEVENEIKQLKNATFSIFLHLFEKIVKSAYFWVPKSLEPPKFWCWIFQEFLISFIGTDLKSFSKIWEGHLGTTCWVDMEWPYCRTDIFKNSIFLYKLSAILQFCNLMQFFKTLLKIGWHNQCTIYSITNPVGLKLLTHRRLGLSHLNKHRFNPNFQNFINPLCSCSHEIESTSRFLLHWHHFTNISLTLLNSITEIICNTFKISDNCLVNLLFGNQKYTEIDNSYIISTTMKYLLDSKTFRGPLI